MLAKIEPEHPDTDFDPAAHEREVKKRLTLLVWDIPAVEFGEFLREMSAEDWAELRARLVAKRTRMANIDLANFIDRMWVKWNRASVEAAMEKEHGR